MLLLYSKLTLKDAFLEITINNLTLSNNALFSLNTRFKIWVRANLLNWYDLVRILEIHWICEASKSSKNCQNI